MSVYVCDIFKVCGLGDALPDCETEAMALSVVGCAGLQSISRLRAVRCGDLHSVI